MNLFYFDTKHAIFVHNDIINKTGGIKGFINIGILESVLEHIKNDELYPSYEDKLTHLFYCINKNHSFNDGNKRAAIALSAYFLQINGYHFKVNKFIQEMENIAVDVADNRITKKLLFEIIFSFINEENYSEELKLKLISSKISTH